MSDVAGQVADHDVRLRALSPVHSFIVQAPAGSGKTELLTQRFLRLLATVQQPEHILAITFTRKAASEMRNRILQALHKASEQPRPEQAHHAQTWDLARAALHVDQQYQWQLLLNPSRLRIQTIDALNAALAHRLPILSGTGTALDVATDTSVLYESAIHHLLEQLGDGSDVAAHLEVLLLHTANRIPALMDMLCDLLGKRDQWLPLVRYLDGDEQAMRSEIEGTLRAAIEHHLQLLLRSIPAEYHDVLPELVSYAANNRLNNNAKAEVQPLLEACASLSSMPGAYCDEVLVWRGIAAVLCKDDGDFYLKLNKVQGFPAGDKDTQNRALAMLNVLREIKGLAELFAGVHSLPAAEYSEAQWQVLAALLNVLPQAVAHLKLEFQQRGQIDFVEQSLRALDALGTEDNPTDLALTIDMRLQHILVDEFQDTSITQMKLLRLLTAGWSAGDGRTLFCVGDPMQSIYRFRQAEVGLFLDVQQRGLPAIKQMEALQLQTNFRSTQPVIDWINTHFVQVLPAINDSEQGAVKFSPSRAAPHASQQGYVRIHAAIDRSTQQEANEVTALVAQALQQDARQRIAILVGGRSHVNAIAAALNAANIPFSAVDIEHLRDRSLIQDLISLTRALLHLGDRTAWLACLRAPWCGLTLHDLHAIASRNAQATIWSLLNDAEVLSQLQNDAASRVQQFKRVMQAALQERGRHHLHDWVRRCWVALHGPAVLKHAGELQDANAFFARLDEIEEAGDLADFTQLEKQLEELFAVPDATAARVEIMTIHKSKGLEFDVVIIPSMHRAAQKDKTQLLRWAQLTGLPAAGLVLSPPQERGGDEDAIHEWLKQLEQRRTELERGRLLYVATTRAKRELHLFGSVSLNSKGEINLPRKGTLLNLLWHAVEPAFSACVPQSSMTDAATHAAASLRRLPLNWQPPAIADTVTGASRATVNAVEAPIEFDWVSETSRHVGTVVHAELELLMNSSPQQKQDWQPGTRRLSILSLLAEQGVPEALREAACERVIAAIENVLDDERGRWIVDVDTGHHDARSELALSGVMDGVVVNSVIDRTFVDAQGIRWIIDFKTSTHEGGDLDAFLHSEEQRYRPQLQRYAALMRRWKPEQPVKTALYFPLLRAWRELT